MVYADDFTLRILGGKTMVVVFFIIILLLLALFIFILPYIIIAGIFAIPIYVTYYCIKQHRNRTVDHSEKTYHHILGRPGGKPYRHITDKESHIRSRLERFDLSEEEAELLFGERWKNILVKKKHI